MDSADNYTITKDGYLSCDAYIAAPGILEYPEGIEYFPPSECFDAKSIETAKLKPIVMDHGFDGIQYNMLSSDNINNFQIGYSGENVKNDNNAVKINVLITHQDSIDQILEKHKEGKNVELSMGYTCKAVSYTHLTLPTNREV